MKILCKNILLTTAVCLSCMLSTGVSAKVCFVGDQNCGSGGSFNDYEDQGENACLGVVDENGKQIYQKGPCGNGMQVTAYCPYDSSYVQCCGKEYVYNTPCVYPLVSKGKCGNKYKCECDASNYKYTDNECKTVKATAGDGYENSYATGSSCTQMRYDSANDEIVSEVKYSSCQCDRGLYPKLGSVFPEQANFQSDCDYNAEKTGPCSTKYVNSNRTETYYKFCRCNTADYTKTDSNCYPLTGDGNSGTCFDTIMHYKQCATCVDFPARNLDHVAYPGKQAKRCERDQQGGLVDMSCNYEVCPHDQSGNSYFKIWKCDEPGYEVNSDGSACVKISCSKAVTQFIAENKDYGLFDGKYVRDADGNVNKNARYGIVADSISLTSSKSCGKMVTQYKTVCTAGRCVNSFNQFCQSYMENQTGIICNNGGIGIMSNTINPNAPIKPTSTFCCTSTKKVQTGTSFMDQGALGCAMATSYYSPQYVVYNQGATSSDGARAMNVACETTPKISSSGNLNGTSSTVSTYGIDWDISLSVEKPIQINNGKVTFSNYATIKASTTLIKENGKPNASEAKVSSSTTVTVQSAYRSTGYDYDVERFNVINPNKYSVIIAGSDNSARIKFDARASMTVQGLAALKYAELRTPKLCVGTQLCDTTDAPNVYFRSGNISTVSTLSLYDAKYWLYEGGQNRQLIMGIASLLGNENGEGSEIAVKDGVHKAVAFHRLWDNCNDDREWESYPYITSGGNVSSRAVGCSWYESQSSGCRFKSRPDDVTCSMNQEGTVTKKQGGKEVKSDCRWHPKKRCGHTRHMDLK